MQSEQTLEQQEPSDPAAELKPGEAPDAASLEKNEATEEEKDPVAALQEDLDRQKDKYLRLMAEFDNYKRRSIKEYDRLVESANERLMLDIIDVREGLERALGTTDPNGNGTGLVEGLKLIFTKLDESLKKNGLEVFALIGDVFNPELHDAMMKAPHAEIPEDHIVAIYEKGYKLKNRIIKHAKVIVSAGAPEEKGCAEEREGNENCSEETPS